MSSADCRDATARQAAGDARMEARIDRCRATALQSTGHEQSQSMNERRRASALQTARHRHWIRRDATEVCRCRATAVETTDHRDDETMRERRDTAALETASCERNESTQLRGGTSRLKTASHHDERANANRCRAA